MLLWPEWETLNLNPETTITIARRHAEAKVFGDTAVVSSYSINTNTEGGKVTVSNTFRNTHVMVRVDGDWKIAHVHLSKLVPPSQN